MVVIYVPEDKRWEKLGQGLGGLLGTFVEAKFKHSMADDISQMSQDPKYANNPQQLYIDAEAKYPGFGGSMYLKSMDVAVKQAQIKELGQRSNRQDLLDEKTRLEIQYSKETNPLKKDELEKRIRELDLRYGVESATAPARKELPAATLERTRAGTAKTKQETGAGEQSGAGRSQLLAPPTPEPEPEPDGGGGAPEGALGPLGRAFPEQTEQVSAVTGMPIPPPPTTPGPPVHPLQTADVGTGAAVMPSLQTSGFTGTEMGSEGWAPPAVPPPAPAPTTPRGPAIVPGPNLIPPAQPAIRRLQPAAGVAPATTAPAPPGSQAPPVPTAPQVPAGSAAASQPAPTAPPGLPEPGSPEYQVQADTVKARVNQKLINELRAVGITHPQQIMRVYDAISQSDDLHWQQAYHTTVNKILEDNQREVAAGRREAGVERRHQETIDMEEKRLGQAEKHYNLTYNAPRMMPTEMRRAMVGHEVAIEGLSKFLEPGAATGGVTASIKKWMVDHGFGTDPQFSALSTEADQMIADSAMTGGGFGGQWRTKLAELSNPDVRHYNYIDTLKIGAIAGRQMRALQTMYDELKVDPHQQANLPTVAKTYAHYKQLYDEANTLWWGQERGPQGQPTDNYHFYYRGREVDRNLKPIPGQTSIPDAGAHYRLKSNPEVTTTGDEINQEARKRGMLPSQMMGNNWELVR